MSAPPSLEAMLSRLETNARFMYSELSEEVSARNWRIPSKPWSLFFDRFTAPAQDARAVGNRLLINSHEYQTNYCIIAGFALLYYVLFHPSSIFVVAAIVVAAVFATSNRPLVINNVRVTRRQRVRGVALGSLLLLVVSGVLRSFLFVFSTASTAIIVHALFRHTTERQKISELRSRATQGRW